MNLHLVKSSAATILLGLSSYSHAACVLPVADGGTEHPSKPNIVGTISAIHGSTIVIHEKSSKRKTLVFLPPGQSIYTAFGGDGPASELKPGQLASVWFVGCKAPAKGLPVSDYFQIFSTDPKDRP